MRFPNSSLSRAARAPGGHGQQLGVVRGGQRSHEVQRARLDVGLVGGRVLPGVVDEGQLGIALPSRHRRPAGHQLVDHAGELGDVGAVGGIGVAGDGDAPVHADHQAEAHQA